MEELHAVISKVVAKHPDDIDKTVNAVERWAEKSWPEFNKWKAELIRSQFRNMIHDARHGINVQMRRDAGVYGGPAKVKPGESVQAVNRSLYLYLIDGRTLGSLQGSELPDIAAGERERAEGHTFNARLLNELRPLVGAEKTVADAVSERRLRKAFKDAEKGGGRKVA